MQSPEAKPARLVSVRRVWLWRMCWVATLVPFAWALGVIALSDRLTVLRICLLGTLGVGWPLLAWRIRHQRYGRAAALSLAWVATTAVALGVRPRQDASWAFDCAEVPWAEIDGDVVTVRNFRNFDWQSAQLATPRWENRTVHLSALRQVDFIMVYWGSPHICHTMVTFDFGPEGRICVSVEARREADEQYSPLAGALRRHELAYVIGDERDVLRLRTNFRAHNDVYLFRLAADPAAARAQFLDFLAGANRLRQRPAWYHSLTTNCTTVIRRHAAPLRVALPLDWRLVANGHVDEYLYRLGYITRELPLPELKRRSRITDAAKRASLTHFSEEIRQGLPGFQGGTPP